MQDHEDDMREMLFGCSFPFQLTSSQLSPVLLIRGSDPPQVGGEW